MYEIILDKKNFILFSDFIIISILSLILSKTTSMC